MENIELMYYTLRPNYYIIGIADWKLRKCINRREYYKQYLKGGKIIQVRPEIEADILIIMTALVHDCLMITNDKFEAHLELVPSEL